MTEIENYQQYFFRFALISENKRLLQDFILNNAMKERERELLEAINEYKKR